jgi:hypothetical protein
MFQPSEYVRTSEDRFHGVAELWWVNPMALAAGQYKTFMRV